MSTSILGSISRETFLRDYWQKKPLLIRQALPDGCPPLDQNQLAGLALEDGIESRVVMETGPEGPWQLFNGPFSEDFLQTLPEQGWTLLIQAVDHLLPEVGAMLDAFDFLPRWRIDDIMISTAAQGGSVGPHSDYYDVFLLQSSGSKRWQLGQLCDETTALRQDTRLKILADFQAQPDMDWVLEPGDLLYLPPRWAHWGTALSDESTTWSIGFRALSAEELLCGIADFIGERLSETERYTDPELTLPRHIGEIDDQALARAHSLLQRSLAQPEALAEWFGRAMTQTKYADQLLPPDAPWEASQLKALIRFAAPEQALFRLAEGSRIAFHAQQAGPWLFADGEAWRYPHELQAWIEILCAKTVLHTEAVQQALVHPVSVQLILALINQGSLYPVQDMLD